MIAALIVGTLLAVGALAFVLYPLFFGSRPQLTRATQPRDVRERDSAIVALREIEFDRATGKLSEVDYAQLKARYTQEAVLAMRRDGWVHSAERPSDAEIEATVLAYRARRELESGACPTCGPRPEADAVYCSGCGRYLRDRCADCGAPVDALDARYCVNCGSRLAA